MERSGIITKFERAKILGTRAEQLAFAAKPTIEVPTDVTDPLDIVRLELQQSHIPLIIRRTMPDGTIFDIKANTLLSDE